MSNVTTSVGERSSAESQIDQLARISKLPAWPRELILKLYRQRDEAEKKHKELLAKIAGEKSDLRELYLHWSKQTGGCMDKMHFKQIIIDLLLIHSVEDIKDAMTAYLAETQPRFISLKNFAEKCGVYTGRKKALVIDPNSDLSPEEQRRMYRG